MMVNIMYGISPDEKPKGNTKIAVDLLEFNPDGKVDFAEFKAFHKLSRPSSTRPSASRCKWSSRSAARRFWRSKRGIRR